MGGFILRNYDEMLKLILDTAENDERIRAVTMEGSNTTENAVHDKYSDFDICFFVRDIREFTREKGYMGRFGEILIMQCPDDWYEQPYDYESRENFAYLTQYKDGSRIDLTLIDVSNIAGQKNFDEPRKVLINKDNFEELRDISSLDAFLIKKPSEQEYFNTCNEFRWIANYVTKGLCREQFYYAKRMKDEYLMDMFMKMLNWKIAVDNDFKVTTGVCSKYLEKYLTKAEMTRFKGIFAGSEYGEMWFKLFMTYDYFAELAKYVGEKLGYFFDEEETKNVKDFMWKRMEENRADKAAAVPSGRQVMLLGDSLRLGYQPVVARLLEGKATVSGPAENGRWAGYTLNSLRFWINGMPKPDVIHWNCGLWDLGDDYNLGRPFSLPEEFESALERTVAVVRKLFPGATLIMATIMPTENPDSKGMEDYNEIIKKVAAKHDVPVDDLFPVVKQSTGLFGPDHLHLTEAGYELVGSRVAEAVEKYL